MTYRLVIKPSAGKELERLDDQMLRRIDAAILKLKENPHRQGMKKQPATVARSIVDDEGSRSRIKEGPSPLLVCSTRTCFLTHAGAGV